jgi:predicted metalloprotease with PDZ domain
MYYADLLPRQAGLPGFEPTRRAHLEQILARYEGNSGYGQFSAESVSAVAYGARPGALGDYALSTHLQGEVLGTMLDFIVRSASDGRRSLDDVLRLMLARFSGRAGFTGKGIEEAVHEVCGCPVHDFFERYVRRAGAVEFERYLRLVGLRLDLTWQPAVDDSGRAVPDLRIYPYDSAGDRSVRIILSSPDGIWGQAGLHTTDRVLSLNGATVDSAATFRDLRNRLRIGDTARVEISRPAGSAVITVVIRGYDRPVVRLEDLPDASETARRLRAMWEAGTPEQDTSGSAASASKGT